jgi:hypothetical protein
MSRFILDTRLSEAHYVLCTEAIRRGIITPSDLNEGRRTMDEQWAFYNNQPPLAAYPRPTAPHIWAGKANHAIDANSWNGAARRLANFYESQGVDVVFNVPGENWHFQPTSESQLLNAANRIRDRRDLLISKVGETEPRINFFKFQLHYIHDPDTGKSYFQPGQKRPDEGYGDKFTPELETSVKKFQRDHDLKADGVIGPITDRKIDAAYTRAKNNRTLKSVELHAKERKARVEAGKAAM